MRKMNVIQVYTHQILCQKKNTHQIFEWLKFDSTKGESLIKLIWIFFKRGLLKGWGEGG